MDLVTSLDDIFDSIKPISIPAPSTTTDVVSSNTPRSPNASAERGSESSSTNTDGKRGGLRRTNSYLQKREAELEKAAEKNEVSDVEVLGEGR
jgi:hypothetical protein